MNYHDTIDLGIQRTITATGLWYITLQISLCLEGQLH